MNVKQETNTCLIRISTKTRDLLKAKCKEDRLQMVGYADLLISEGLANSVLELKFKATSDGEDEETTYK